LKVVDEEVAKANAILNDPNATAEEVTAAINGLTKAMAGLEANPTNPESTVKPGDTKVNATKTGDTTSVILPLAGLAIASLGFYGNKKRKRK
ncbi:MAG: LPXTG cell wall anchor domain-containing protein, partial [Thomasclavelia sp.]|uniref:LPXTG cell wall anchor domain-containing protein n=2 Tax=Thomasclavelia sp. TaxID=3025757 RepID=UPI00399EF893